MKPAKLLIPALIILLAGCTAKSGIPAPQPTAPSESSPSIVYPQATDAPTENIPHSIRLEDAVAVGDVIAFSSEGCTLSQITVEGSGDTGVMTSAAPGFESEMPQVEIRYQAGCTFQYLYASLSTEAYRYEDAACQDVKKQTTLYVFGTKNADGTITADHVVLFRLEK